MIDVGDDDDDDEAAAAAATSRQVLHHFKLSQFTTSSCQKSS